jgi:hypothetical protein
MLEVVVVEKKERKRMEKLLKVEGRGLAGRVNDSNSSSVKLGTAYPSATQFTGRRGTYYL